MLTTILNIFKIKELRNKVLFTLSMLVVFRIGHWIPVPGVNQAELANLFKAREGSTDPFTQAANFVSMFSGGTLSHSTIFGLGVMPYITASIIFQLVSSVSPKIKKLQEEGPTGRQKVMEWTRYAAVGLCVVQGLFWLKYIADLNLVYPEWVNNPLWWIMGITALTAGTVFLMWIGEQIDRFGIGNGISLIIMAGILTSMPGAVTTVYNTFDPSDHQKLGWMGLFFLMGAFCVVVGGAVLMTVAQRRIPIQQAKHTRGRKVFGGQRSYLPLRVNHGGVMPIVFASSIMSFPPMIFATLSQRYGGQGTLGQVVNWVNSEFGHGQFLYALVYIAMVYFFAYFWITVQFNPQDMSKNLRDHGSFIPGLRPGPRTAEYLEAVITRVTFVGAGFLALIAVMPMIVHRALNIDWMVTQFFGGTGLLIVVSVVLDLLQRVEANLLMRNYGGFLSGGEDPGGPKLTGPRG